METAMYELLISEVQKRTVLWNKFDKKFKDRIANDKEWNMVAKKTNLDKEDAKKKWRNLRDTFLKENKNVKKGRSGDSQECAEIYTGKWMYYKLMIFLKDTVRPRNTEGNISDDNTVQENSEFSETDEIENDSESDILSFANNPKIEQSLSKPESENEPFVIPTVVPPNLSSGSDVSQNICIKRKKKQPKKEFETKLLKLEQQKITALTQSNTNPVTVDDEDMQFLKSLRPYFRSMNPLKKLQVRNQFQTVLINELSTQEQKFSPCNEETSFASSIKLSPRHYLFF